MKWASKLKIGNNLRLLLSKSDTSYKLWLSHKPGPTISLWRNKTTELYLQMFLLMNVMYQSKFRCRNVRIQKRRNNFIIKRSRLIVFTANEQVRRQQLLYYIRSSVSHKQVPRDSDRLARGDRLDRDKGATFRVTHLCKSWYSEKKY